jgi:hypothetical protein
LVDTAPRCRGPGHVDRGTDCDRFDQGLPTPSEAGESGASFVFAATVGSLWRATPQLGQRSSCAGFSWYGPSGFRQLQCHSPERTRTSLRASNGTANRISTISPSGSKLSSPTKELKSAKHYSNPLLLRADLFAAPVAMARAMIRCADR